MRRLTGIIAALLLTISVQAQTGTLPGARPPTSKGEQWWANAVFYQVFVRSFQDSNGDGIGDFKGLTSRLDYLKGLGVNALWLMPINPSPSYHGYDVTDYLKVNPQFGSEADFDAFLAAAHERGMKVIMDWVVNHSSSQHPWFLESKDPASPKRDWYLWRQNNPGWGQPWGGGATWHPSGGAYYYGAFWGGMPDLNWRNEGVRQAMFEATRAWLKRGVDGFRIDAARYVIENENNNTPDNPTNLQWVKDFMSVVRAAKPDAGVVMEVWNGDDPVNTAAKYFLNGEGQDMGFNFGFYRAAQNTIKIESPKPMRQLQEQVSAVNDPAAVDAIFLSNHDVARLEFPRIGQNRSAADMLLTLPGVPFIYYGDEIGLPNAAGTGDEPKRTPMRWTSEEKGGFTTGTPWYRFSTQNESTSVQAQDTDAGSLLNHYRKLIALRQARPQLRSGGYHPVEAGDTLLAFVRFKANAASLVIINPSDEPLKATVNLAGSPFTARGPLKEATTGKALPALSDANAAAYEAGKLVPYGLMIIEAAGQ
jgi:alpha-amylase